ncbi:MAG: hypothetical protein U0169_08005 [Polyangiaceae bacterium]
MNALDRTTTLLGFVQIRVGAEVMTVPVQAVRFDRDHDAREAGGFFAGDAGQCGILVDEAASPRDIETQIARGSEEALRHISRHVLN